MYPWSFLNKTYKFKKEELMVGEDIKKISIELSQKGYLDMRLVSSTFDVALEKAVKDFQRNNGLVVTGEVGKETWEALFKESNPQDNINHDKKKEEKNKKRLGFFENEEKVFLNNSDIVITIAGVKKIIIKDVVFRSKSHSILSDGTPIKEVYSFIGKDLKE